MHETKIKRGKLLEQLGLNNEFIRSLPQGLKRRNYRAAFNWLNLTQDSKTVVNNESSDIIQIQGFLEAIHHLCEAQDYAASLQVLKAQIEISISGITDMPLYSYLLYRGQGSQLLKTVDMILEKFQDQESEKYFLRMLKAKASESLGDRSSAVQVYEDICKEEPLQSKEYIEAFARLANCQIQMGQYQTGVPNLENTLRSIEKLTKDTSDPFFTELKTDILEGLAFYQMNKGSFSKAFDLFGEVFRFRQQSNTSIGLVVPLAHQGIILRKSAVSQQYLVRILLVNILRLFGMRWFSEILYDKLCRPLKTNINQNYERAENLLRQASDLSDEIGNAKSWIAHHIAWVIINRGQAPLAEEQALSALKRYEKIEDQKGISDCHEQLGRIYLSKDKLRLNEAEVFLNKSLSIRQNIENLHGASSSILSLSFLYWHQRKYLKSFQFLINATRSYHQIGMLNMRRILGILTLFSVWTVGDRDWTS